MIAKIPRITGVMVQYYHVCKRELWFFAHHLEQEESDYLDMGRLIHEESYFREKKDVLIDDVISLDLLRRRGKMVVLEIKKSSKLEDPVRRQLLYYLWYLKQKGVEAKGEIVYPKEKKKEEVILSREIEEEIPKMLKGLEEVIKLPNPPSPSYKSYCTKCSYYELCWC